MDGKQANRVVLKDFLYEHRIYIILSAFFVLLAYGIKLFHYSISIDTEAIINDYDGQMYAWLSIGRFGLVLTKFVFGLRPFNVYVAAFMMIVTLWIVCIAMAYMFKYLNFDGKKKSASCWMMSWIFITMPMFAEQFNFALQGFEVAFAVLLIIAAAFVITLWVMQPKRKSYLFLGLSCMVWGFASYQAVTFLYISLVLAAYVMIYTAKASDKIELNDNFFKIAIFKYLGTFAAGYLCYVILNKIIIICLNATPYLDNMVYWGKVPVKQCIGAILGYIWECKWYFLFVALLLVCAIRVLRKVSIDRVLFVLALTALICSPFFLSFYLGHELLVRSQFSIQFVMAFAVYYLGIQLSKKIWRNILLLISCFFVFRQAIMISGYLYTDYVKYQKEVLVAEQINSRINELEIENLEDIPVVYIGHLHLVDEIEQKSWEVIGYSFFEWDYEANYGNNYRIWGFMKTLGFENVNPTSKQIEQGRIIADTMQAWPANSSVKYEDGIIIVKLSDM